MTDTKPEALRLAEWLETSPNTRDKKAAAELRRLHEVNQELVEALELGLSACQSVSLGRDRKIIDADGEISYWQTEEWCKWLDSEVAPKLKAALAKARGTE